jgi:hypothetical protein
VLLVPRLNKWDVETATSKATALVEGTRGVVQSYPVSCVIGVNGGVRQDGLKVFR